ncbi:type I secretion C-terminal target domain (VC_A0849 subclass) [Sphingomonas laterariae]|uniref:Type I secretion C-terminal target domain (VC_A0849 subclass) n=2 Tax=Edaphosphingomonas laterariae TaxID=861865 RepID=A0A239HGL6_9SPHN|nr:type I secretion C-terminal target domain (VC_A0849 subclass) [Sphingomonas laterariae]
MGRAGAGVLVAGSRRRAGAAGRSVPANIMSANMAWRPMAGRAFSIAPAFGLPMLLAACGGGGGGGGSRPETTPTPPPAPAVTPDSATIAPGAAAATGNVLANDTPAAGQAGAPTVSAVAVQGGAAGTVGQPIVTDFGTLTLNSNGSYSYAALDNAAVKALAAGQTHTDIFSYTVTNSSGSQTGRLNLTITGVNDAPVAVADSAAVAPGTMAATGNVLTNDSDVDAGTTLAITQVNGAAANVGQVIVGTYGSLKLNADGSYSYTLDNGDVDTQRLAAGQSATESFTYRVSDGAGGTTQATLTLTVTGTNDAPVATVDMAAVTEDAAGNVVSGNVLANDSDADAGTTLAITQVNGATANVGQVIVGTYGSLKLNADGSYSYTLDNGDVDTQALAAGQRGEDVFSYLVGDGAGGTTTGQITVTVNGHSGVVDDVVTIDAAAASGASFNLFANDDGSGFQLQLLQRPDGSGTGGAGQLTLSSSIGTLTVEADGAAVYGFHRGSSDIGAGQSFTDYFKYSGQDASGQSDTATIRVTISRAAERTIDGTAGADRLVAEIADTVLNGGSGNDVLVGGHGRDVLNGGAGDDRLTGWINDQLAGANAANRDQFIGGAGDDVIVGGHGSLADVAIYSGKRSDYSIQVSGDEIIVRDLNVADGDDGIDRLTGIELLQFSDQIADQSPSRAYFGVVNDGVRDSAVNLSGSRTFAIGPVSGGNVFYNDTATAELLTFDGATAPSWLRFDTASQRVVGTAPVGFEGTIDLVIRPVGPDATGAFDTTRLYFYTPRAGDVVGSNGVAERFVGSAGADRVFNMGRDDVAVASAGADVYEGSPDEVYAGAWPLIDYSASDAGIFLDLGLGVAQGGYAEGDIILNVGSIIGTSFADQIIAGPATEVIDPGAGDDIVIVANTTSLPLWSSIYGVYVWGGEGADTIQGNSSVNLIVDYSRSAAGITLTVGARASGGDAEGDLLTNVDRIIGTRFDDLIRLEPVASFFSGGSVEGGDGNDRIEGNDGSSYRLDGGSGNDQIFGFDGDDGLTGGGGADMLDGGAGIDTAYYQGAGGIQIDLTLGTAHGGDAEGDTLVGIENIHTEIYADDVLIGNAGDNVLSSQGGNDRLYGMAGDDTLEIYFGVTNALIDGGDGIDTFRAGEFTTVDLAAGTATKLSGGTATLISIENVEVSADGATVYGTDGANVLRSGTSGDTFLYGRGGDDRLEGSFGNDVLEGGSGADRIDGGPGGIEGGPRGIDTASYAGSTSAVQVDLRTGLGSGGDAAGDTLFNIENLDGGSAGDVLVGSDEVNMLRGNGGNDILLAIGGGDQLAGGNGDDLLIGGTQSGGAGNDVLVMLDGDGPSSAGGTGADTFLFDTAVGRGAPGYNFATRIQDFTQAEGDRIDLSDLRDGGGAVLGLQDILDNSAVAGGNLVIDLSSFTAGGQAVIGSITLAGINDAGALGAADFIFSGGVDWQAQLPAGLSLT